MGRKPATKEYYEFCEQLGNKLKIKRKQNGLTQGQLSDLTGLPRVTIHRYEDGTMCPTLYRYLKICRELRVHPTYFLDENYARNK